MRVVCGLSAPVELDTRRRDLAALQAPLRTCACGRRPASDAPQTQQRRMSALLLTDPRTA
jgi:hypothetical protein